MAAVENLRTVINERLTEAVEDILGVFTRTLSVYEEEICRQRTLLDIVLRPEIKLHRTEFPLQNVCEGGKEVVADQQLCFHERSSGLDREDQGPQRVKEEPEEQCGGQEEERLVLTQATDLEGNDQREVQTLQLDHDRNQKAAEQRSPDSIPTESTTCELELGSGHRFVFHASRESKSPEAETSHKPFECDVCGRDFYLYTHLKVHMMTHPAGKPFSCAACGKGFSFKRNLKRHMATHSSERPHACDRCPRTFHRVEHLQVHTRSHTGEKPYRCLYCEKALSTNSALAKHVRRHTGQRTPGRAFTAGPGGAHFEPEEFASCLIPKSQVIV
ncbi:zinc finger protein 135-like [Pseudoliparis swirei]|uniref:zinc finger protein 135-like n=1 Tax=Pseudoliparis swirei TaxID=2059687 RepID=UPI0024BD84B5|nr:zinc finger protein 135-like [Pseudoliparis swirei]